MLSTTKITRVVGPEWVLYYHQPKGIKIESQAVGDTWWHQLLSYGK